MARHTILHIRNLSPKNLEVTSLNLFFIIDINLSVFINVYILGPLAFVFRGKRLFSLI